MEQMNDVLFEEIKGAHHALGIITLNRPSVLNSLNQVIIEAMYKQLKAWAGDDDIRAVIIKSSAGRAFCAGGDLRLTYDRMMANDPLVMSFFAKEYELNRLIHHYSKPYIAFLDGITMGGGVGISIHGSHRLGTDNLLFAMPETGIGFFPDVGGTYFLPRLPHEMGIYLGLTGARMKVDHAKAIGLITHKVKQDALPAILKLLLDTPLYAATAKEKVTEILNEIAISVDAESFSSLHQEVQSVFQHNSLEAILTAIKFSSSDFLDEVVVMLNKKSPTSLRVTLRALREGALMKFDDCMKQELTLATNFLKSYDFREGIRAVIIDKDQSPQWEPHELAQVTDEQVLKYFK